MGHLNDICVDCADPWTLGHWWAEVSGYRVRPHDADDLAARRAQGTARPEDDPVIAVDPEGNEFCVFSESPPAA